MSPLTIDASQRNRLLMSLRFLYRRHYRLGLDCDYLLSLGNDELNFMHDFCRRYYDGKRPNLDGLTEEETEQQMEWFKETNHRRYALQSDCFFLWKGEQVAEEIRAAQFINEDSLSFIQRLLEAYNRCQNSKRKAALTEQIEDWFVENNIKETICLQYVKD